MPDSLAAALENEHREIDAGIAAYLRAGDRESLAGAVQALRRHIYLEEEFLFPPLRDAGLMAPVFVMLREHGQIWGVLDLLDAALTDGAPTEQIRDLCRKLEVLEQHHNPKEEQIIYPQADHVLTGEAGAGLRDFLDSGELPDGWVCERAGVASP